MKAVEQATSTNTLMAAEPEIFPHGGILLAREQTAGRGQRGNSWEAEPGMNITMSLMLRDLDILPRNQFAISEAVALGVADAVARRLPEELARQVAVKWPNDIYVADKKIAGILIECVISGSHISHAIAGIGLNVRQTIFRSDAPNPTSLAILGGRADDDLAETALEIGSEIVDTLAPGNLDPHALHARYLSRLWRRNGIHTWRIRASGATIRAAIADVAPDGILTLAPADGSAPLNFLFKEVEAIL